MMDPIVQKLIEEEKWERVLVAQIGDGTDFESFIRDNAITAIPTFMFYCDGQLLLKVSGVLSYDNMTSVIECLSRNVKK